MAYPICLGRCTKKSGKRAVSNSSTLRNLGGVVNALSTRRGHRYLHVTLEFPCNISCTIWEVTSIQPLGQGAHSLSWCAELVGCDRARLPAGPRSAGVLTTHSFCCEPTDRRAWWLVGKHSTCSWCSVCRHEGSCPRAIRTVNESGWSVQGWSSKNFKGTMSSTHYPKTAARQLDYRRCKRKSDSPRDGSS